ncbi:MAG: hypothetical protein ABH845_00520 [Candidatus Omnitrophota bacterium]
MKTTCVHQLAAFLIVGVIVFSGCARPVSLKLDGADTILYGFGGGESGADYVEMTITGDGLVAYSYFHSYWPTHRYQTIQRIKQLPPDETKRLFQRLVNAGLFRLQGLFPRGPDIPGAWLKAEIDGRTTSVTADYHALRLHGGWEKIVSILAPLVQEMRRPEEPEWLFPPSDEPRRQ